MSFNEIGNLSINRLTSGPIPDIPFAKIKDFTLGKNYKLSLVFPPPKLSRRLAKEWKGKDHVANVLSFPIEKNEGEIYISLGEARREAASFGHSYRAHVVYLFIHGLLHLKGLEHGSTMESKEQSILDRFGF